MNQKVYHTLEYYKILDMLAGYASCEETRKRALALTPITDAAEIEHLQQTTSDALSRLYKGSGISFAGIHNVNASLKRLDIGGSLNTTELLHICSLLEVAKRAKAYDRSDRADDKTDSLSPLFSQIEPLSPLLEEIKRCVIGEDEIADDASPALFKIRKSIRGMNDRIHTQLTNLMNNTTTRNYLQDAVITMRDGRYCLPVKAEAKTSVPGMVHDQSSSGSTLFIEPMAVVNLNNELRELFLKEQLMAGNINDNLVVIYRDLLKPDMINKDNAAAVAKLFHIRRVTVNNKNYAKVIVRHKEIKGETEFPVLKNTAFIQTYTDNVSISFVSNRGNRFNGGKDCTITTLFDDESIVKRCLELNPDMENVMIGYCDRMLKYPKQSVDSIEKIKETISYGCISEPYRKKLISRVIEYYYDGFDADGFESFIKTIDESNLSGKDAVRIMEIRIIMGEYDKAYALLKNHSAMNIVPKRLMKMCSKKISCVEEEKKRLVEIAYIAFSQGAYDDNILKYLIAYYNGATDKMVEIWKAAGEIEEDTFEFEERILAQMMFTGKITDISIHIFSHYCSRGPKDRIVKAYLSLNSYLYFVKECSMPEELFELIEAWFENEKSLSDVCKMALLKYYSSQEKLTEYRKELASVNLYYLARKGIVFPFYQSFEKWIHLPYDISDRTMIEYKADPKSRVVIHYMYESKEHKKKYVAEDMKQVYEGIFVKQFVLFYGETMQYYISEETDGKKNVTDSVTISNNCIRPLKSEGRYEMLNDIIASQDTHEPEALKILVHSYAVNNAVTEQMFTML